MDPNIAGRGAIPPPSFGEEPHMPRAEERRTLHLLRHAKSSWDDPGLEDHDRPLAPRGRRAARLLAAHIAKHGIAVDLVLCSSAVRARQTLELVGPSLGGTPDIRTEDGLYAAGAPDLLSRLRSVDDRTWRVLMIGHNPGLEDLAEDLAGHGDAVARHALQQKFPTGALATLSMQSSWRDLSPGAAYLESLLLPRRLEPL
jgi:phosphohistidine phosphatase